MPIHESLRANTTVVDRVALFVRAPVQGRVKARLAAGIGTVAALEAHRQLTLHALRQLADDKGYCLEIWCSHAHQEVVEWSQQFQLPVFVQAGSDLGERMANCLASLCRDGGRGAIVGSDCPSVDKQYLLDAFLALDNSDLVLGPAEDGGYGLIAWAREQPPAVFHDVIWGSSQVLAQTQSLAHKAGLRVSLQSLIWDVDTIEDWRRFQRER